MRASPPARRVARSANSRPYESAHSLRATVLSGRVVQAERALRVGVSKAQDGLSPWSWSQMPRCDASPPARRVARSADSRPYESAHSLRATVLSGRVVQAERARRVGASKAQDGLSPWSWSQMPRCDAGRQNCTQTGACGTCLRPSAALFRGRCALKCSQRASNMSHMYNKRAPSRTAKHI